MKGKLIATAGLLAFVIIVISSFAICASIICHADEAVLAAAYVLGISELLFGVTIACHLLNVTARYWHRNGRGL